MYCRIVPKNQDDSNSMLGGKNYHTVTGNSVIFAVLNVGFGILKIILKINWHSLSAQKYLDLSPFSVCAVYQT